LAAGGGLDVDDDAALSRVADLEREAHTLGRDAAASRFCALGRFDPENLRPEIRQDPADGLKRAVDGVDHPDSGKRPVDRGFGEVRH
jgi:hypothetical protein